VVGGEGTEERGWGHFGGRVGRPEGDERREDGLTDFGSSAGSTRGGRYCWGGGEEDINRCFPFVLSDGSRTVRGVVCEERGWSPPAERFSLRMRRSNWRRSAAKVLATPYTTPRPWSAHRDDRLSRIDRRRGGGRRGREKGGGERGGRRGYGTPAPKEMRAARTLGKSAPATVPQVTTLSHH
jgi:hypothetical protein